MKPSRRRAAIDPGGGSGRPLFWHAFSSPLGLLRMAQSDAGRLVVLSIGGSEEAFLNEVAAYGEPQRDPKALASIVLQLEEYFEGRRFGFDIPWDLGSLTPFQQAVLHATAEIPYGVVRSYKEIAEAVGKPHAARAVGQALGMNPIAIVIPCHRVIASDGTLGGYSGAGGLAVKEQLLRLEGAMG